MPFGKRDSVPPWNYPKNPHSDSLEASAGQLLVAWTRRTVQDHARDFHVRTKALKAASSRCRRL